MICVSEVSIGKRNRPMLGKVFRALDMTWAAACQVKLKALCAA